MRIAYNRITFFLLGVITSVVFLVILNNYEKDDSNDDEELNENYDNYYESQESSVRIIPDSVFYRNKWEPLASEKINNFYRVGEQVYWSDIADDYSVNDYNRVEFADAKSFKVVEGSRYAKDRDNVYWIGFHRTPVRYSYDYEKQETYLVGGDKAPVSVVDGADPASFVTLGYGFACDKKNMYFEGDRIVWDDRLFDRENCKRTVEVWKDFIKRNYCK